jgi:BlaI family penicillinase repressor|nr:BlaI/MecI/CopY family transcriptional regulator [uncultured Oscillibacter sp.]
MQVHLTASEWNVLECLWRHSPQTVMKLVAELKCRVGWAKSTTITTLRRMEEKGLVRSETIGKAKHYTSLVAREEAEIEETHTFLDRVYRGSVGLMVSTMARRQALTQEDIAQLRAILDQAEGGGGDA